MLASQVLHAGRKAVNHTLRDIVDREIGQNLNMDRPGRDWSVDLTPDGIAYAANHAAVLLYLAGSLREKLGAAGLTSTADLEMKSLLGIAWANGIGIDFSSWNTRAEEKRKERDEVLGELFTLDPEHKRRNWNSPPQVLAAFAAAGIEIASTNSKVLVEIDHPLATALRRFRAVDKFVATYEPTWAAEHVRDGRIIPCWTPLGTATGRMSCSKPNLQQIPKAIGYRRCFVAAPGHVLVKGDYSQIELRIVAKIAKEERMLAAFSNNQDLHTLTAAAVTRKPANEVTETDRDLAKSINFGLLYGMGDGGLFDYAHKNYGIAMTLNDSRAYRTAFFSSYPGLRRWHDTTYREPSSESRTLGGRRRLCMDSFRERLNTPVQGTGADGLKSAIALLWLRRGECPGAVPVLFVHDEIVVECVETDAQKTAAWLKQCMLEGMAPLIDPVSVQVEVTIGRTWAGD